MSCAPLPPEDKSFAAAGFDTWTSLMEQGVKAWAAGCSGWAETFLSLADAQSRAMGQLTGLGLASWQAMARSPLDERLREPLLFAGDQAARIDDGVRQTMRDLEKLDGGETIAPPAASPGE